MTNMNKNRVRADVALAFVTFLEGIIQNVWNRYGDEMCRHLQEQSQDNTIHVFGASPTGQSCDDIPF